MCWTLTAWTSSSLPVWSVYQRMYRFEFEERFNYTVLIYYREIGYRALLLVQLFHLWVGVNQSVVPSCTCVPTQSNHHSLLLGQYQPSLTAATWYVRLIVLRINVKQRSSSGTRASSDDSGQKTSEVHLIACIKEWMGLLLYFLSDSWCCSVLCFVWSLLLPGRRRSFLYKNKYFAKIQFRIFTFSVFHTRNPYITQI